MQRRRLALGFVLGIVVTVLGVGGAGAAPEEADDGFTTVPFLHEKRFPVAVAELEGAGLRVGTKYEMSWRRALDRWGKNIPIGAIIAQAPKYGRRVPKGTRVAVIVSAVRDGLLPRHLPPPSPGARGELGTKKRQDNDGASLPDAPAPAPKTPETPAPKADDPKPADPVPAPTPDSPTPTPDSPTPTPDSPTQDTPNTPTPDTPTRDPAAPDGPADPPAQQPPADEAPAPPPVAPAPTDPTDDAPRATGSPEAPRPAPKPNRDIVPPLMGLDLAVAEQLCRDAKMTLYVERVAGHPVGRVLEQAPEAYEPRGAGGVVKVLVTAGGDFEARIAPPAAVHVDSVDVPELLDRTEAQALRILRDLRLVGQPLPAKRGLPGRVANQKPLPGQRIPVGGLVKVYIGPARDVTQPKPTPPPGQAPVPTQPPTSVAAPRPVSPAGGTPMPKTATLPVGFTWQPVPDASAYVLEVEEQGAGGAWMQSLRKPVRKTAAMVEIERLDTTTMRPLRWRVRAIVKGVQGNPSVWVVLR